MTSESIAHAQLADSSKRLFASKSSNSSASSSSRTGTIVFCIQLCKSGS